MLPYATAAEAEAALGRVMTRAESAWFRYSAAVPDHLLFCHTVAILLLVYTLAALPLSLLELTTSTPTYKLQPRTRPTPSILIRSYLHSARALLLSGGVLSLFSYPTVKLLRIRAGLPLPSAGELAAQLAVYQLVNDYAGYWFHRLLHTPWAYQHVHRVHHRFNAPFALAAPYAHWTDVLFLGVAAMAGPALVPCHMITLWLWFLVFQLVLVETHCGFDFPFNPTKLIPFYGGAEHHDYHHLVGEKSRSNFAPVFTYCDYLYGTDKGYKYHKASQAKLTKEKSENNVEKGRSSSKINSGKQK
ncbi:methylsterol monooxygenase 1-1 [Brachypodium distachyon]|uniref:aldehyde oxygenase (deformylating) n=1 Tax=Brachypodium distachyon TaxID=15368 RepID=I1GWH1_BRADI|nr:methylsterol monooxygenase 1-1 [Brachypodium distachyon]KQK17305.1 hypothetical protein BRADI_1g33590v3 [Brachypodium distachyon]|eukprot:XP_003563467.1 methylsterol monooxygenase 1-1 [Brachypodium distachyon]